MKSWFETIPCRLAAFFIFALSVSGAVCIELPERFAESSGLLIEELSTGNRLVDHNSGKFFIPASVTKLVTSAAVMSLCDSTERFATTVFATGKVKDGRLDGNVVIYTVGDPTLQSSHLRQTGGIADSIASALVRLGISSVSGRVMVDERFFDQTEKVPAGWMDEDLVQPYGAELFATNYRDNRVTVRMPGGSTSPVTPALKVESVGGKGALRLARDRNERRLRASGTGRRSAAVANPVPWSTLQNDVESALAMRGIRVDKAVVNSVGEKLLYRHLSPRYVDILRSLMVRSDNLMAEGLLRSLAPGMTRAEALLTERETWDDYEITSSGIVIEDGSGLSRNNRISPRFLRDILKAMSTSRVARSFVNLFPRVGEEGTVRGLLKDTPLQGRLVMKSGSMRGVQSYAGYMLDETGRPTHIVVFMSNGFKYSRDALKRDLSDILLQTLAESADRRRGSES